MALDRRVSYCCISAPAAPLGDAVIAAIGAAGVRCVRFDPLAPDSQAPLVVAFIGQTDPDAVGQVCDLAQSRPGRVLAALLPEAGELSLSLSMQLLASGCGDVVMLDHAGGPALVAAILSRWILVDDIVVSDVVVKNLAGRSRAWTRLLRQAIEAARFSQAPVLVTGETGTGKELVARLIHTLDTRRSHRDLIVVDCTTLAPELAGSELFGHQRGAFTGAVAAREGAFALADGGTLFLDEIGELPLALQGQLLRAIQERIYKPVGGNSWTKSNFRLVCATNRDLKEDVAGHRFRSDLYHRIAGITCRTPALRERIEDVPLLAAHFLCEALEGAAAPTLSPAVLQYIVGRDYPGNVRDLRLLMHAMARYYLGTGPLTVGGIPEDQRTGCGTTASGWRDDTFEQAIHRAILLGAPLKDIGRAAEDIAVRIVLSETDSTCEAARRLGVSARAIQARRASLRA